MPTEPRHGCFPRRALRDQALAHTFLLYFRSCNRCPRCGVSFSKAPAYESRETSGLALFERIERCPFCAEPLDARADGPGP